MQRTRRQTSLMIRVQVVMSRRAEKRARTTRKSRAAELVRDGERVATKARDGGS